MLYLGVFGTATGDRPELVEPAGRIGRALAAQRTIVITGGCSGLPYAAASAAAKAGAEVWGFSPVRNREEHRRYAPEDDLSIYTRLIYVPETFPYAGDFQVSKNYRNLISTACCDAGIIIAGKWGTLNEFTNLVGFGKVVGVLSGSGDIASALPELAGAIEPKMLERSIIVDHDPERLVTKVVAEVQRRKETPGSHDNGPPEGRPLQAIRKMP